MGWSSRTVTVCADVGDVIRGPWEHRPDLPDPALVRWRRGRPLEPARPHCAGCHRPFSRDAWIPVDRLCRDCRLARDAAEAAQAQAEPSLFDDLPGGDA